MSKKLSEEISFGQWLHQRRRILDLTQQDLADQVGCARITLRRIESGTLKPSKELAVILLEKLGAPQSEHEAWLRFARGLSGVPEGSADSFASQPTSNLPTASGHEKELDEIKNLLTSNLPTGTVTFLFTDIEGSTQLWEEHPDAMKAAHGRHESILRQVVAAHGGYAYKMIGDAFQVAFATAPKALAAALDVQRALHTEPWPEMTPLRVRMALHTGVTEERGDDYVGPALNRAARLLGVGHGGQVLLTQATYDLVCEDLPKDAGLRDLGEHRLKDLVRPEHIYQLIAPDLPSDYPPLKALATFAHNLPAQVTSFIGREKEQKEISDLIADHRLVTLTGAGGIGKTRLSIQVASSLRNDYPNGIWLVELAPLSDPTLMPQAIVTTLGLIEQAGHSPLGILTDFLQEKRALLVLDNCEHLIQACAQLAEALLHSCPDLHILATSREQLSIAGETLYLVPPLITPDPIDATAETLTDFEAVQLFLERAQATLSNFSISPENALAIAQICHNLDGIPLALELAAARVRGLSVEQIASRLNDRFRLLTGGSRTALPRHQTLQALIDWSHNLLSKPERVLLRRLSVFAGGWTLQAAESVCPGNGLESEQILDLSLRLVDKSLVVAETQGAEPRYHMLETIRQYAREKLWAASEGDMIRQQHLVYFVELVKRAEPNLRAFDMVIWLDRLETELDNIRVALEWAQESDIEAQLRLASALLWFWHIRGRRNEGIDWLDRGLSIEAIERGEKPLWPERALIRGKTLNASGILLSMYSEFEKAREQLEESLTLFQELGPEGKQGIAYALLTLAKSLDSGNQVQSLLEQSLHLFHEVGDKFGIAECLMGLADNATYVDDFNQAAILGEEHLALRKEIGDQDGIAVGLTTLGNLAFRQEDYQSAITLFEEGLMVFREVGNKGGIGQSLVFFGDVFLWQGDYEQASKIYGETLAFAQRVGDRSAIARYYFRMGFIVSFQGNYARATQMIEDSLLVFRELGLQWYVAVSLHALGSIALAQGNDERAEEWYEAELAFGQQKQIEMSIIFALYGLSKVAWTQGDYGLAAKSFKEGLRMSREASLKHAIFHAFYGLGRVAQSQDDYATARAFYSEALGIQPWKIGASSYQWVLLKTYKSAVTYPLDALAALAITQNQMERAVCLFGAAETLYPPLRIEMSFKERAEHDHAIATARAQLSEKAFATAYEEGKKMTLDEAIAYALQED